MGNFTTSRDCKIDDKEIKQSEELGINFSKVHTDIHKAIFLRFSWRYFWKIFVLSKDYSNRYNTKYFWLEKAYIDILNYFDEYPNRWNLDYSRKVIAEKFDDILLSLDSYKPINNENKCEGCDTEEEDSDTDDFWTNKQRQRNHHINHDSESSWANAEHSFVNLPYSPRYIDFIFPDKNRYLIAYLILTNLYDINSVLLIGTYKDVWNYRHKKYSEINSSFLKLKLVEENIIAKSYGKIEVDLACITLAYILYPDDDLLKERINKIHNMPKNRKEKYLEILTSNMTRENKIRSIIGSLYDQNIMTYLFVVLGSQDYNRLPLVTILNNILMGKNTPVPAEGYLGPDYLARIILWHYSEKTCSLTEEKRNENIPYEYLSCFQKYRYLNEFIITIAPSISYIEENAKLRLPIFGGDNRQIIDCSGPVAEFLIKSSPPRYEEEYQGNLVYHYLQWKYGKRKQNKQYENLRPDDWETPDEDN